MVADGGVDPSTAGGGNGPVSDGTAVGQIKQDTAFEAANADRDDIESRDGGGINPRLAAAQMRGVAQMTTAAIGRGFQFTPDQIETQLAHANRQLNDLNFDRRAAQQAAQGVRPPAPDQASTAQSAGVAQMLVDTAAVIESHINYLTTWRTSLNQAKANYMTAERVTEEQWHRVAKGLDA
jgi:hypothetical protein